MDRQISPAFSRVIAGVVGTPYEKMNCWELVRKLYRSFFAIDLKSYHEGSVPEPKAVQSLVRSSLGDFVRVDGQPQFGDIILIRLHGLERHIAMRLENNMMIHSIQGVGVNVDRINRWYPNIVGYYRHKEYGT